MKLRSPCAKISSKFNTDRQLPAHERGKAEWGANPREWVTVKPQFADKSDTPAVCGASAYTGCFTRTIGNLRFVQPGDRLHGPFVFCKRREGAPLLHALFQSMIASCVHNRRGGFYYGECVCYGGVFINTGAIAAEGDCCLRRLCKAICSTTE